MSLWNRIEQFSLDEPKVALPFSRRLARENRWPIQRAESAIREYKRFIFLGCVADHPVSPSEDVDQVWHLHLAYSKSYWKDFCEGILGRPFHHNPTKGGADESKKFEDWYAKTLASYRAFFGVEPPRDIWPERPIHHELQWVDTKSHWVIAKPNFAKGFTAGLAGIALLGAGCGSFGLVNVFDWKGPDFLNFFLWFSIGIFLIAALWRNIWLQRLTPFSADANGLDPYELAYLSGKGTLATNAALIALVDCKLATISSKGELKLLARDTPAHPLERALVTGCSTTSVRLVKELRPQAKEYFEGLRGKLEHRGLLYGAVDAARVRSSTLSLALIVPAVALIKIVIGMIRDKPVVYLVLGGIVTLIFSLIYFGRQPFRTPRGDDLLKQMRDENSTLRRPRSHDIMQPMTALPLAIALFGLPALQATPYSHLKRSLTPQTQSGGDSGGCGSSCGSSCGGGGGGGGGCGGGGCGGCGGGGGD